ncbi:hypothetical protein FFWV33_02490 [Flavobacterium faecale]|uniref:LamG-like jellyroll fold domain-containing protein n=1 Tax=Flavobacterium faecale TaxID=1355330 RepID=A0A2S1LA97_9FLAO|nr:hypothetical protein [Flavobacterium faecale]AWG20476.1 hypothetical protein FFWV33_02490 [Flavobacterium faecale]
MLKTKLFYFWALFLVPYLLLAQIAPTQNIVCQNEVVTYSYATNYDTYKWTVIGGTPSSSTASTINVTWGYGNRGTITFEGFISGVSQGVVSKRIYIDQKAAFTPTANPTIVSGQTTNIGLTFANKSIKLNGTSDYVAISNSNLINLGTTDYRTVMLWFKANDVTTRQVLYNEGGGTNGFSMYIEGGKVYCLPWEGGTAWNAPNANIVTGQWYHVAFVFDQNATDGFHFKGYLNGTLIGAFNEGTKASNGLNGHSGQVAIGSNSSIRFANNSTSANNYFNGRIDGFKLWNRSLLQSEVIIEKDHVLNAPVVDSDLDVYINFDNSVLDLASTASAEDGALSGSPTYDDDVPLNPTIVWSPGGANTAVIAVNPTTNTSYTYTLTEKLSNVCSQTGSIDVFVTIPNDKDGDGVGDIFDLDADNDGILNAIENNCLPKAGYDGYWSLDNTTNDLSGNSYNAQSGSSVSFSTDSKKGTHSASFNGTSNYLQYSNGTFLNQAITNFSYSIWIKPSSLTGIQTIFEEGGTTNGIAVRLNGATLEAAVRESNVQLNTATLTYPGDGLWHHIALTYSNGNVILYLDGVASTTLATGFGELAGHSDVQHIGYSNGGAFGASSVNYYGGLIDDIVHYPSVLSASDISKIVLGCDNDNDGIPNYLDTDSDNDGSFDANEAYGAVVDTNNDGTYGGITGSPQVDALGRVLSANYATPLTTAGGNSTYLQGVSVNVTTAPVNKTVCEAQTATFSATATTAIIATTPTTTASTTVSYQWQVSTNNGSTYTNISGQSGTVASGTSVTLTLTAVTATMTGNRYRIKFTNEANVTGATATATLTVNPIPTITQVTSASSCGVGSVVLKATASAGTINWYAAATGGTSLATGTSFTTSVLSTTTSYWVDATNTSCTTATRTQVTATVSTGNVEVAASAGTIFGCYSTVKEAFDKINDGTHQGDITIKLRGNTTEIATATLNNTGNGASLYSSLLVYPTAPNLKIEGNVSGQLINLNGADNVIFDGRVNQLGGTSLTLSNTNTAGSVIQFITDATANTVRYCTIQGTTASAASGLIVFGLGDVVGNDNNTIEFCDIRDGATTPTNAIYSSGSSVSADNSSNTVSNSTIYNYFSATASSNGIYLAANSSAWTISNNKFYQTAARTTITAGLTHRAIYIVTASGVNYTVNNNVIGYSSATATGTTTYTGQTTLFRGIEMSVGTTTASNVQGNTISNINFSTAIGTATNAGIFSGIAVLAGNVNIGTAAGNTIGATTGIDAIQVSSTASTGLINGIYVSSVGTVGISNNTIGAISTNGGTAIGYTFYGIYTAGIGGNFAITDNTIGSKTTANSITVGDASTLAVVCTFRGIFNSGSGLISITNNTIQNTTVYGTSTSGYYGIINTAGSSTVDINTNSIISGTNTGTNSNTTITYYPIYNSAVVSTLNINNNIIRNQLRTATGGYFTAIGNVAAVLTNININGNQLGNTSGGLMTYSAANTVALFGINNSGGAASCELSIQNNDIRGIDYTGGSGSNTHTYISNGATTLKQNISNNTFTNLNVNTTGTITFLSNSVVMPANGVQNIDNNSIVTGFVRNAAATSGALTLFTSGATTNNTGVVVTNNNNNFSNITVSGASTILGWVNNDAGTGNVDKTIYNNKFENWTAGSGGVTALNVNIVSEMNKVYANSIQNISSSQIIYGITSAGNDKIYLNTINNLNSTSGGATSIVSGINVTAGTAKSIYQNTISNLIGNTLTTGSVRGILVSGGTTVNLYENKIFSLSANANTTGTISGIWVTGGSAVNIDRNKIYDISSSSAAVTSGIVYGIQVSGTTASLMTNVTNNIVGDLKVSAASGTDLIRGLGFITTGASSMTNAYYNTVYLNAAASSGTNFGSTGIYHTANATATTAALNLRNNIIINVSTPKGSGTTVAFRRSAGTSSTLNNYATTSKNNLFYAGTPGTTNLIYSDGTSTAQTFAQYKSGIFTAGTIAPRDQVSVSENLNFISTVGSNANFLKVNTTIPTQIESGAVNIADYEVDYLGVVRQGNPGYAGASTSAPDMGAYENNYVAIDASPPSITYTALTNNSCLSNKTISATITDATGVNVTAGTRPRIYFKKLTNSNVLPTTNTSTTDGWKYIETTSTSSPFSFSINYNLIFGGVTTGDVIQYFVTAQDIVTPSPYVGINTGVYAATPASVALTSAAFPIGGTINSFTILAGLNGTVTVGSGGTYPTLTGTGGLFAELNTKGLAGNLTANIVSDITEPGTISLNQLNYGCTDFNTLTISPSGGAARTISGTVAGGALLNFNGADYVVIDGLNTGGNSLIISNASTASTAGTSTIRFINDATNNTVRNCTIEGASTLTSSGTVFFSTAASVGNVSNAITGNIIKAVGTNLPTNAIYSSGSSVLIDNSDITISNNTIQDYFNAASASNGIYLAAFSSAWTISGNKLFQTATRTATTGSIHRGINIITAFGVDYSIVNNTIGYTTATATGTTTYAGAVGNRFFGIEMNVGTLSTSSVQGNKIAGINLSYTTSPAITAAPGIFSGISILGGKLDIGTTTGNTIGATTGNGSITLTSSITANYLSGIYCTSTSTVNIKNNTIGSISTTGALGIGYTFHGINTAGGGQFTVADNTIGSTSTANSIAIGTLGTTTTGVCLLNGIYNLATGGITISGNTIQNVSSYGTAASVLYGILNSGASGAVSIANNSIIGATNTGTSVLGGISNTAVATTVAITGNKIRNFTKSVATGAITAIANSGAVLSQITIENNQLGNTSGGLVTYAATNSTLLTGISNSGGSANCALSIQNNDLTGITYAVAGVNANTYIANSAATLSQTISGNTFTALNVNTTGTITFIANNVIMPANGVQNVNNNSIVTSFTRAAASGAMTLFTSTAATNNSNVVVNNNNNNFSNITVNGTASISGWINTDAGTASVTKTISGNTFENWNGGTGTVIVMNVNITSTANATTNNTIRNINSLGSIYGIITGVGNDKIYSNTINSFVSNGTTSAIVNGIAITSGTVKSIYQNIIYGLQSNNITSGSVSGIGVTGGANTAIYQNKIYDISSSSTSVSTGTVNGILVSGTTADQVATIYNNRIGGINATAANAVDNVRGISMTNTGVRSISNIYFNSMYLNASSTGTNFGSSGIFHAASTISSTAALNLRNNIIVNLSTANGTGFNVAFRQGPGTSLALNNYNSLSNNNLFYAGVPSATNLIYANGTNSAQDITAYKAGIFTAGTIAPRDQLSVSENPQFISTTGSSVDFLKILNNDITFIESGAVNIAGITTDFEGQIRAGNTGYAVQTNGAGSAPDIGADEFDGKLPNVIVSNSNPLSNGSYSKVSGAFTAINSYDQTGKDVVVTLIGSTTEDVTATLNQGAWTSLKMYPTKAGVYVSGDLAGAPLLHLNGADNVTIDGRVNQTGTTKSMSITNNSTSNTVGTATVRLSNSAELNTLKYLNINGSSNSATNGIVEFGTSTTGNGNDSTILEYNAITNAAGNRAINAIYSLGTVGRENSSNSIRNNTIFDFVNNNSSSNGINLSSNSSDWTISNNSFYETNNMVPTTGTKVYTAILIDDVNGNNFVITGNYIGGKAALNGGGAWTVNANTAHSFRGMYLNVGAVTASSIQSNLIQNFNYTSSSTTPWRGIEVNAGTVNIGTTTGNIIGAATGTGSINLTTNTTADSYGIYVGSANTVSISKNNIGSIALYGNSTTAAHSFAGIYKKAGVAGTINIVQNIIGSNGTSNSIASLSTASTATLGQNLIGVYLQSTGTHTLTSNTIVNLTNAYSGTQASRTAGVYTTAGTATLVKNSIHDLYSTALGTTTATVNGVEMTGTAAVNTVTETVIYNLSNTNASLTGYISGIVFTASTGANLVNRNFIRNLSVNSSSTNASIYGIRMGQGTVTFANNIVTLGGNTGTTIYGIFSSGTSGNNSSLYFNTVYINGSLGSGITNKSYAFYEAASGAVRDLRNNIFSNFRTTSAGTNAHYAAFLNYSGASNLTLDYNIYWASGTGGVVGYYSGSNVVSLPIVSGQDANSINSNPGFSNAGGLTAADYKVNTSTTGIAGTSIILDYAQTARGIPPNIGAWEFNTNSWVGNISTDFNTAGNWSAGSVPLEEASIVFAASPVRDCILDQDRIVGSVVNGQSAYTFKVNGKVLTLRGDLYLTNGGQIDATAAGSTVIFESDETQTISSGAFVSNTIPNLTINNEVGVTSNSDLTITGFLNLLSANPSETKGTLDTGAKIVTMGADAVTIGDGDLTGIVQRNSLVANKDYSFNGKNMVVFFENTGTLPTSVSLKLSIGANPSWKTSGVKRIFSLIQTGAVGTNPTAATIKASYLDSEINNNDESKLVYFSYRNPPGTLFEHGRASINTTENWVKLSNINMAFFPSTFGSLELGFSANEIETLTWNGSFSTSWTTVNNWTPNGAPSDFVNIIIPDAATTINDPIVPIATTIRAIKLQNNSILNAVANAQMTLIDGANVWVNEGGVFNPNTSTVLFKSDTADISGATSFYNVTVDTDANLLMKTGSTMRIAGAMNNIGVWRPAWDGNVTTVEYNGANQNVVIPYAATNRYSNLTLSGSGTKTLPATNLSILGNLTLAGTASVTTPNSMVIVGDLSIGANTTFDAGANTHTVGGNFTHNGVLNTAASTFVLNGLTAAQNISGTASITEFNNLVVLNSFGVTSAKNITVNAALDLQSDNPTATLGSLDMGTSTLSLTANAVNTGTGDVTGIVKRAHTFVTGQTYTFGNSKTLMIFGSTGTKASQVSVKTKIGAAPTWKTTAVKRVYDLAQIGASDNFAIIQLNYLDSELNGADESQLVFFGAIGLPTPTVVEYGYNSKDESNNSIDLKNVSIGARPSSFGQTEIALSATENPNITWNGSQSTDWNNPFNWSPNSYPNKFTRMTIPNATTTTFDPILPSLAESHQLIIQNAGILNAGPASELYFYNENAEVVWQNAGGTFNAGTSTVIFTDLDLKISGATNFNNIVISSGASLTPQANSTMGIVGTLSNNGILDATTFLNTINYNGATQNVVYPNGTIPGYYNLSLSGTDVKTMPNQDMDILGDLNISGLASVTANNVLDIAGNISIAAGSLFNTGTFDHEIGGDFTNNGSFTTGNGNTILLNGAGTQTISGTGLTNFKNLAINNGAGVNSSIDLSLDGNLNLVTANPTAVRGALNMTGTATLNMRALAVTTGMGDVSGIVRREHVFNNGQDYDFGNPYTTISFLNVAGNTKPTWVSTKIVLGATPSWRSSAINRYYSFAQSGGNDRMIVKLHYLDSELNAAELDESRLVFWDAYNPDTITPNSFTYNYPRSYNDRNVTDNWVQLTGPAIDYLATSSILDVKQWGLSYAYQDEANHLHTWTGSGSAIYDGDWSLPGNWNGGVPVANCPVLIPNPAALPADNNGDLAPYRNLLPINAPSLVSTLEIASGATLVASDYDITVAGNANAWVNNGGFTAGTATVYFSGATATISGTTNFNNVTINSGGMLTPQTGAITRIAGAMTNNGPLNATAFPNTVEYNGTNQMILNLVAGTGGYHNLILSNSGTKTMMATSGGAALKINGDFTITGTAVGTAVNPLAIKGNFVINPTAAFTTGAFTHQVGGNFTSNGTFTASTGSTLEMNGTASQTIGGTATALSLKNLTISNTGGTVSTVRDLTCSGDFTNSGTLDMGSSILSVSNSIANTGTLLTGVPAAQSMTPFPADKNWGGTVVYNVDAAQNAVAGNFANLTINNGVGVTVTSAAQIGISGTLLINSSKKLIVDATNTLTVAGTITNNGGTAGLILESNSSGNASLIHNSNNVQATVKRYISGVKEAWHFIASPVTNQTISGTSWTPSGTYGNGTGYDLYLWNEPTPCWTYLLNTTVAPTWPSIHPSTSFVTGRGYLYSTQAVNPTKEFAGLLNNGNVTYPLTNSSPDLTVKGFNLIGNPYPSSIDWKAVTGWTRTALVTAAGGYDMYIWNPAANNYGVFNSNGTTGTNSVTQYIAPTQGFFVRASTAGTITMGNAVRVNTGANNWMKVKAEKENRLKVKIEANDGTGFDEVLAEFGYDVNQAGALKLFSRNASAPSLYWNEKEADLSVRYLTDVIENAAIPLQFKAGKNGSFEMSFDEHIANATTFLLEDKKTKTIQDLNVTPTYKFTAGVNDATDRFVLHFNPVTVEQVNLPALIYYDGNQIVVDLTNVDNKTTVSIYDVAGRRLLEKPVDGKMIHRFVMTNKNEIYIVLASSNGKLLSQKVFVY